MRKPAEIPIPIITQAAAERIWRAHREIEAGWKLLDMIDAVLENGIEATPLDARTRRSFQLGVPNGDDSTRLLDVSPRLARVMVEAHIEAKQAELAEASIVARLEMDVPAPPSMGDTRNG